jgi:hypothetical protein
MRNILQCADTFILRYIGMYHNCKVAILIFVKCKAVGRFRVLVLRLYLISYLRYHKCTW